MQESSPPKPAHGGSRPGAGRPCRPPTLAAALREAFPVERLVALAERALESESDEVRFRTMVQIWERCHGKVADKLEAGPPGSMELDADAALEGLTVDQLRELAELERRRESILAANVTPALQLTDGGADPRREIELEARSESPGVNASARDL